MIIAPLKPVTPARLLSVTVLAAGCSEVALGVCAMAAPRLASLSVDLIIGFVLLLAGVSEMAFCWEFRSMAGATLRFLRSICFAASGATLLLIPYFGIAALSFVLGALFLSEGVVRLLQASWLTRNRGYVVADGVASLGLGLVILVGWPSSSVFVLGSLVGIRLLLSGLLLLIIGTSLRRTVADC
ncbi:MAG: DUF308 domain-containing protein [Planctomycetaceae bacterium]